MSYPGGFFLVQTHAAYCILFIPIHLWQTLAALRSKSSLVAPGSRTPDFVAWHFLLLMVLKSPGANRQGLQGRAESNVKFLRARKEHSCLVDVFLELTWCTIHSLVWIIYSYAHKRLKRSRRRTYLWHVTLSPLSHLPLSQSVISPPTKSFWM
jgi:hypothetical protein